MPDLKHHGRLKIVDLAILSITVSLSMLLIDILKPKNIQQVPHSSDVTLDYDMLTYYRGVHKAFAAAMACRQGMLTPQDTFSCLIRNIATNVTTMFTRTCRLFSIVVTSSKYVGNFDHRNVLASFLIFTESSKP